MRGTRGQIKAILEYLEEGHTLTTMEAFTKFGCTKLSDRISELRQDGHNIGSVWRESENRYGENVRYLEYRMLKEEE